MSQSLSLKDHIMKPELSKKIKRKMPSKAPRPGLRSNSFMTNEERKKFDDLPMY